MRNGCTPFKTVAWPSTQAGDLSVSCSGSSSSSSGTPTAASSSPSSSVSAGFVNPTSANAAQYSLGVPNALGGVGSSPYGPNPIQVPHA